MKPFQVIVKADAVEVYSLEYNANPKRPDQNLWRVGVSNGETRSFVYFPIARDSVATKNFKSMLLPGTIISFNATVDNDLIVVLGFKIIRKATQGSFDFDEEIAS